MENERKPIPNDHLANERTFLAWIRTCIATIGLGFVVVKFSLFIKQLALIIDTDVRIPNHGYSAIIGIALVVAGMIMAVLAYYRFKTTQSQLLAGQFKPSSRIFLYITIALIILAIALAIYLLQSTR
ncbi:YidH family protein [Olivibacter domesticus]|uniref:Putative membrane protein n=1 Tax=Olivibacter domesticus TaxID=407022 RepID=A0A1H7GWU1_OLID1|nr:DUF202 domain-containing protein [Olivibacter domesticus]SEK41957.1 putative membrane protein [Olivibacter domesticus]